MARKILWAGSIVLPAPVSMRVNDEIIWTVETGRTLSGYMIGDPVAEKKNVAIQWGILTENDIKLIKSVLKAGFFPISFRDDGIDITIETYRGTLTKEIIGYEGDGIFYYRSANVDLIQR